MQKTIVDEIDEIEDGFEEIELPKQFVPLTKSLVNVAKQVEDTCQRTLKKAEETGRLSGEQFDTLKKSVEDLNEKLNASQRRIVFPEADPFELKWALKEGRGIEVFHRIMRAKPDSVPRLGGLIKELQEASTRAAMVQLFACDKFGRDYDYKWSGEELKALERKSESKPFAKFYRLAGQFAEAIGVESRALDSTTAGEGDEWVPTLMGTQILEKMMVQLRAASLCGTINMPSNPYLWPFKTGFPRAQRVTESTGMPANPGATAGVTNAYASGKPTANKQFTAKKIRIVEFYSWEFNVDSIVAAADMLAADFGTGLAIAREAGFFNGSTNTTAHIDSDIVAPTTGTTVETVIDGIRDRYIRFATPPTVSAGGVTPKTEHYLNVIGKLTKAYAADMAQQYWFCSVLGMIQMMANPDMRKLSDLGPNAVILSGQIGEMLARPVIVSGELRDDLNSDGVYAAGATSTAILLAHTGRIKWGTRPSHPLESERLPIEDQNMLVVHDRFDLQFVCEDTDIVVAGLHDVPTAVTIP
jgi:HK97 family phage major capsid protein